MDSSQQWFQERGSPATDAVQMELPQLLEVGLDELRWRMDAHDRLWHIREAATSVVDQLTGEIEFGFPDGKYVRSPVQIVGTLKVQDGTWLWGWANPSVDESLQKASRALLELGRQQKFSQLTTPSFACDAGTAWKFTALAVKVCQLQGASRVPSGSTIVYVTFGTVTL